MNCVFCKHRGNCPILVSVPITVLPIFFNRDGFRCLEYVPVFITPEQYKERTGKELDDFRVVYVKEGRKSWPIDTYGSYKNYGTSKDTVIVATEAGPPPENWDPEETT
jgi:hypothetical protein